MQFDISEILHWKLSNMQNTTKKHSKRHHNKQQYKPQKRKHNT